jgi:hypothetical protein
MLAALVVVLLSAGLTVQQVISINPEVSKLEDSDC